MKYCNNSPEKEKSGDLIHDFYHLMGPAFIAIAIFVGG
jgi:hypothetical protein